MAKIRINWYGDRLFDQMRAELRKRLATAAEVIRAYAVKLVRVSVFVVTYSLAIEVGKRKNKVKRKKKVRIERSKPGEPPRKETGTLQKSIMYEVSDDGIEARIGSTLKNPPYPAYLEGGTDHMAARPWLIVALRECEARVRNIFTKRLPGG